MDTESKLVLARSGGWVVGGSGWRGSKVKTKRKQELKKGRKKAQWKVYKLKMERFLKVIRRIKRIQDAACIQKLEKPCKTEGKKSEKIFLKGIITLELSLELWEGLSVHRRVGKDPQGSDQHGQKPQQVSRGSGCEGMWTWRLGSYTEERTRGPVSEVNSLSCIQ